MLVDLYSKRRLAIRKRKVNFSVAAAIILLLSASVSFWLVRRSRQASEEISTVVSIPAAKLPAPGQVPSEKPKEIWHFIPGPISMEDVKKRGCVADGFLSNYGDDKKEMVRLIRRSECRYLHRSLETWQAEPDFDKAAEVMEQVGQRPIAYGMFLAEAVRTDKHYKDPLDKDREYDYSDMCRKGTEGRWGDKTCIPSIQSTEYRRYLKAITRRAMDLGIQSFLFGQVMLQDEHPQYATSEMKKVIDGMRQYAKQKKMDIIIGGQTDSITDEKYLKLFDYIEGGVGIGEDGKIEDGPCWSRMSSCWALLWNDRYCTKAKNVLLHLDWTGVTWDDMSVFSRMEKEERIETLEYLYDYFTSRNMGFLMPFLAVVNKNDGGCHGPSKEFYSPNKKYGCKDEDEINRIMRGR